MSLKKPTITIIKIDLQELILGTHNYYPHDPIYCQSGANVAMT